MRNRSIVLVVCAAFATVGMASAQDLVTNGDFATSTSGWLGAGLSVMSSLTFGFDSALDANGNPSSGSAHLVNKTTATTGDTVFAHQCVDVTGSTSYDFGFEAYFDSTKQTATGFVFASGIVFDASGCGGNVLGSFTSTDVFSSSTNTWLPSTKTGFVTQSAAASVYLEVELYKSEDTGSLDLHFDNVYFTENPLFANGFEQGNTSAWSSAVGAI